MSLRLAFDPIHRPHVPPRSFDSLSAMVTRCDHARPRASIPVQEFATGVKHYGLLSLLRAMRDVEGQIRPSRLHTSRRHRHVSELVVAKGDATLCDLPAFAIRALTGCIDLKV